MICRIAAASAFVFFSIHTAASAAECPGNPDALGTSRVIAIDPSEHRKIGTLEYSESLPLRDHEVVLTFDDGPLPPHTQRVLDALRAECVKATFFLVGQMARSFPALVLREHQEGHTIGTHSEHHAHLDKIPRQEASKEITDGIASVSKVLGDPKAVAPFFRFPYLDPTPATEHDANSLGLTIWSVDLFGSDWKQISPEQVIALVLERLERKKKGIILLHDIQERTALALPVLLRELKKRGYSVVQAVPSDTSRPKAVTSTDPWTPTTN